MKHVAYTKQVFVDARRQQDDSTLSTKHAKVLCITFGTPMLGDAQLQNFIESRGWRKDFLHVVTRHDIVARVLLAKLKGTMSACAVWIELIETTCHSSPPGCAQRLT